MKKHFILILALIIGGMQYASAAVTCSEAMSSGKPFIVYYTSTNCGACKKFSPIFYEGYEKYKDKLNLVMLSFDQTVKPSPCVKREVEKIPTVLMFSPKGNDYYELNQNAYYSADALNKALDEHFSKYAALK